MKRLVLFIVVMSTAALQAANEINAFAPGVTTAYAVVRQGDGDVWEPAGQVFEAWGTGGRTAADYDIALADKSGGMFVGNMDTNIGAGDYHLVTHYQAGGAPADTDPVVWADSGNWTGSAWTPTTVTPTVVADAVLDEAVESTLTLRQAMRLFLSVLTGKVSGGGTSNIQFRDIGDTKDRLDVTVDSRGNRTAINKRDGT